MAVCFYKTKDYKSCMPTRQYIFDRICTFSNVILLKVIRSKNSLLSCHVLDALSSLLETPQL